MFSLIAVLLKLCLNNNCVFSRLPETRDDSDSTDSEEELDSPRKIVSQPNEKMDVDHSESKTHANEFLKKFTCTVYMSTSARCIICVIIGEKFVFKIPVKIFFH